MKYVVLQIRLITILQEIELSHIILYLQKKTLTFRYVIILIKSVVTKHENDSYYNIFFEKGWYQDQFKTPYF